MRPIGWLRRLLASRERPPAGDWSRWVVLDTETTGIDPARDALLSIGAVTVDDEGIRTADSFEIVLRHTGATDAANVVVHGLGRAVLDAGVPGAAGLNEFREWVDGAPCVGFHADFDRLVLARAAQLNDVSTVSGPWLDLAPLAAALTPEIPRKGNGTLDEWLAAYGVACPGRHNAANDALAAAELLLRLRTVAAAQGAVGFNQLAKLARHRKWLGSNR